MRGKLFILAASLFLSSGGCADRKFEILGGRMGVAGGPVLDFHMDSRDYREDGYWGMATTIAVVWTDEAVVIVRSGGDGLLAAHDSSGRELFRLPGESVYDGGPLELPTVVKATLVGMAEWDYTRMVGDAARAAERLQRGHRLQVSALGRQGDRLGGWVDPPLNQIARPRGPATSQEFHHTSLPAGVPHSGQTPETLPVRQ